MKRTKDFNGRSKEMSNFGESREKPNSECREKPSGEDNKKRNNGELRDLLHREKDNHLEPELRRPPKLPFDQESQETALERQKRVE